MMRVLVALSFDTELIYQYTRKPSISPNYITMLNKLMSKSFRKRYEGVLYNWFLQADASVKAATGDVAFLFKKWEDLWKNCEESGDEIGLHFHTLVHDEIWRQSADIGEYGAHLEEAFNEVNHLGYKINSTRTGYNYGSAELLRGYEKLGIKVDGSCTPGCFSKGVHMTEDYTRRRFSRLTTHDLKGGFMGAMDWRGAPEHPYNPDHEVHTENGDMELLELPVTALDGVQFNFHAFPSVMAKHIQFAFKTAKENDCIVLLHGWSHNYDMDLIGYRNLCKNLETIAKTSKEYNIPFDYATYTQFKNIWEKEGKNYHLSGHELERGRYRLQDAIYKKLGIPYRIWLYNIKNPRNSINH